MTDHRMHPPTFPYGESYARGSFVEVSYQINGRLQAVFIRAKEADGSDVLLEIPKATFDKFIAAYLSDHGETWIG